MGTKKQLDIKHISPAIPNNHEERGNWGNQCDFFLSCLGYAVGLGNVWRFPYLCYESGGGAFLIPYAIFLLLAGLPLFFMELSIGQYASLGPNIVFKKIAPIFQGIGYTMLFITFLVVVYYNMIIAWAIFYTCASFTSELPWTNCGLEWTSKDCFTFHQNQACLGNSNGTEIYWNKTCVAVEYFCTENNVPCPKDKKDCDPVRMGYFDKDYCINTTAKALGDIEYEHITLKHAISRISPSEEYFDNYMLARSLDWYHFGTMRWQLVLCLLLAWLIVCLCLIKGVQSSGKVVYFTALFPYAVLIIFFIKGLTLEGAIDGIKFFITPKWELLGHSIVWGRAATQIFYSLGVSYGCLITMSSYNKFTNNCQRDALVIGFSNCLTSVFAGFVIFSIVGSLAAELGVDVGEVIKSGPGLAFIAYPDAITRLPIPQLWSILFFIMLITLGLDTQFSMVEALTTGIMDRFPFLRRRKELVVIGTSIVGFILGLPLCMEGGVYMFTLIDGYSAGWSLLICALVEIIVIGWVYGHHNLCEEVEQTGGNWFSAIFYKNRFFDNIEEMLGRQPYTYWKVTWLFITPVIIVKILIFNWVQYSPPEYDGKEFPGFATALGWLMAMSSVMMIPLFALYRWIACKKSGEPTSSLWVPEEDWGPASKLHLTKSTAVFDPHHLAIGSFDNPSFKPPAYSKGDAESHM